MLSFNKSDATAVIVIDMQNDFVDPKSPIPAQGALDIIPNIQHLLEQARANGLPVIYTLECHRADLSDFGIEGEFEPLHCVEGTHGAEIIKELTPQKGDYLISTKRRYDALLGTDLDLLLRNLGIRNLIFCGVCTDICVISTVHHARNLDYKNCVLSDCTAGSTRERHEMAFKLMEHCFAKISTLSEAKEMFRLG